MKRLLLIIVGISVILALVALAAPAQAQIQEKGYFGISQGDRSYPQEPGFLNLMRFQNTGSSGEITRLELHVAEPNPQGSVTMTVYSDKNGRPFKLLVESKRVPLQEGWTTVNIPRLPVASGQHYWLGFATFSVNSISYKANAGTHFYFPTDSPEMPRTIPKHNEILGIKANKHLYVMRAQVRPNAAFDNPSYFGLSSGDNVYPQEPNVLSCQIFQNNIGSGYLNNIELYASEENVRGNVRLGVYADDGFGRPGKLLMDTGPVPLNHGWTSVDIRRFNVKVEQGIYYWLAFQLTEKNQILYQKDIGEGESVHYYMQNSGPMPGEFPWEDDTIRMNDNSYTMKAVVDIGGQKQVSPKFRQLPYPFPRR